MNFNFLDQPIKATNFLELCITKTSRDY